MLGRWVRGANLKEFPVEDHCGSSIDRPGYSGPESHREALWVVGGLVLLLVFLTALGLIQQRLEARGGSICDGGAGVVCSLGDDGECRCYRETTLETKRWNQ